MKLPNGDQAFIDARKLTEYSLSPDHDDGKHKARVFQELLGITLDNADVLLEGLRTAAQLEEAASGKADRYGQRYVVDFDMAGPNGNVATVRSAWIVRKGEARPRLVSCYVL